MKKRAVWLVAALVGFGLCARSETVITSPTGLPDESDVVLEAAVDSVKSMPTETLEAIGGAVGFTVDELRNTAHGVAAPFKADPRGSVRRDMLADVDGDWDRAGDILMRSYTLSEMIGTEITSSADSVDGTVDAKSFFQGVKFTKGTSAVYRPGTRRLIVCNTEENLRAVEALMMSMQKIERSYKQVEIEAKFIEVSQSTLDQLGFTWTLNDSEQLAGDWDINGSSLISAGLRTAAGAFGGAPVAGTMTLTKTGWMPLQVVISALEQAGDSDVLSSPKLTALDGKTAEIWVGERRNIPTSFDTASQDINIHIEHRDWDSQLMGVHFKVKPEIQKDNQIRLKLNPAVIDLIGYDTYQVCPESTMMPLNWGGINASYVNGRYPITKYLPDGATFDVWTKMSDTLSDLFGPGTDPNDIGTIGSNATDTYKVPTYGYYDAQRSATFKDVGYSLQAVNGSLPYFRVRQIDTEVAVADGSTVGLGGLIYDRLETYKDKIPVLGSIPLLGRLFRSEGERSIKRNLMIFVSATQVGSDGVRRADLVSAK